MDAANCHFVVVVAVAVYAEPATAEIVAINGRGLGYVFGSHGVVWPAQ